MGIDESNTYRNMYRLIMEPTKPETLEDAKKVLQNRKDFHWISEDDYKLFIDMLGLNEEDTKTSDLSIVSFND